jgi:hypothetical protein
MGWHAIFAASIGGLIVAFFNSWRTYVLNQETERRKYLDRQLSEVYGPLHFYCQIAREYSRYTAELHRVSEKVYGDPESPHLWKSDNRITDEISQTIVAANQFTDEIRKNNQTIASVLASHWDLVDPSDMMAFQQQALQVTRNEIEFPAGEWKTPLAVRGSMPPAYFVDPAFSAAVQHRFTEITTEVKELQRRPFSCSRWIARQVASVEHPSDSESPGPG